MNATQLITSLSTNPTLDVYMADVESGPLLVANLILVKIINFPRLKDDGTFDDTVRQTQVIKEDEYTNMLARAKYFLTDAYYADIEDKRKKYGDHCDRVKLLIDDATMMLERLKRYQSVGFSLLLTD
jgi:hypothetical protein